MRKKDRTPSGGFNYAKFYRRLALLTYDILSVIASSMLALLMRYEFRLGDIPAEFLLPVERFLPICVVVTIFIFYLFRLYDSLWAYAGETELQGLVISCVLSDVVNIIGLRFFKIGSQPVPQSYYFLYLFLLITLIFISRFSYRFMRSIKHRQGNRNNST